MSIRAGQGYWLSAQPRALETGDVVLLSPLGRGAVRASQLTELSLSCFLFQPERLSDLLTPVERQYLESEETQRRMAERFLSASTLEARELLSLTQQAASKNSLAVRSGILQWIASVVGIERADLKPMQTRAPRARERFRELVGQMTENDLIHASVEALAAQCRCSTRHLNRLFQESFQISLSARQTELRMQRAAKLLRETELKVAEVAAECGYRHIGLFNATFKRRWSQTPTILRLASARTPDAEPVA
ncbi:MAG: helix-turn-helix transcriptional regulator [Verrucomicrobia bacterium]|nr:helix-turn-helix transcriptional regulator [Verrucomicrobiota bacterium]